MVVARVIGAHVARAIEPYRFDQPPVAKVHGTIPMHGEDAADLHFELKGGPFNWWRFHVPAIEGNVHWLGQRLILDQCQPAVLRWTSHRCGCVRFPSRRTNGLSL